MKTAELRGFQRRFLRGALAPGIDTAALSIPRGNGKTSLAAHVVARALTPGDPLYERGREIVLISGSLAQSRFGFKIVRRELEPLGLYRWSNSTASVGAKDLKRAAFSQSHWDGFGFLFPGRMPSRERAVRYSSESNTFSKINFS